ncbi:hypothetical protein L21SP5_02605 [Salinivirga cyanobacteriivorans]|uniref:Outer membrane protein beta-barrel domain-containing protein n=1 Tax=Salinivirga cyanobacteriivorans TaxID=1307839 RepID=A0A0S2I1U4_9BACT|nr:outer membrane beta-barrel protein [Salinivirga cyanobacteriivorans]ALO16228.1 hypothetical protein L21SP5_02605 [Salinivirga cyanobacteriivorans]
MCKSIIKNLTKSLLLILSIQTVVNGQNFKNFTGTLKDRTTGKAIPFANVVLLKSPDSDQLAGAMSNINGNFTLHGETEKATHIKISHLSYRDTLICASDLITNTNDTATILLNSNAVVYSEIVITADAIKGKSDQSGTTYFINEALKNHSASAIDIVKRLPGIQIDFTQNLNTQNNGKTVLFIDGKQHEINYLQQIPVKKISKISINQNPGVKYGGDVTTVIHITMKKDQKGLSGQVYSEIPTDKSLIYMFPKLSLSFAEKKYQISLAYNGKMNYFNILEEEEYKISTNENHLWISNKQYLRQKTWSQNFNYSADVKFNKKQLSFFGSYNPYSQELDGDILTKSLLTQQKLLSAVRKDQDINHQFYNSINYQQIFGNKAKLISNFQHGFYKGKNVIIYDSINEHNLSYSSSRPAQHTFRFNTDLEFPVSTHFKFNAGTKASLNMLENKDIEDFSYQSTVIGNYGAFTFARNKINISAGIRLEYERSMDNQQYSRRSHAFMPNFTINLKLKNNHNLHLLYNKSIHRPYRYQLNPVVNHVNTYQTMSGNSQLKNQINQELASEYHFNKGSDYYAFKLFYVDEKDVISQITTHDDSALLHTTFQNAGRLLKYGFSINSAVKYFTRLTIYGNLKVYNITTLVNNQFKNNVDANKNKPAYEISVSALLTLPKKFTASLQFQYVSPQKHHQRITMADPLCFASFEKHFKNNLRVAITGAVPISHKLLFGGEKISGDNFTKRTNGYILLNKFPVWFSFTYNFSAGKKIIPGKHKIQNTEQIRQKGF